MKNKLVVIVYGLIYIFLLSSQELLPIDSLNSINDNFIRSSDIVEKPNNDPPFSEFFSTNFPKGIFFATKQELLTQYGNPERVTEETDSALVSYGNSKKTIQFQYQNAAYYSLIDNINANPIIYKVKLSDSILKIFKRKYTRLAEYLYYDYPPDQIYDYSDKMYERGNFIYLLEKYNLYIYYDDFEIKSIILINKND